MLVLGIVVVVVFIVLVLSFLASAVGSIDGVVCLWVIGKFDPSG